MGVFPESIETYDEELRDQVLRDGTLFHADDEWYMFMYDGAIYALDASSFENALDTAVLEAGFATEPLRHCLQELYECLYVRMLNDPVKGFSNKEWEACRTAKKLLGLT